MYSRVGLFSSREKLRMRIVKEYLLVVIKCFRRLDILVNRLIEFFVIIWFIF